MTDKGYVYNCILSEKQIREAIESQNSKMPTPAIKSRIQVNRLGAFDVFVQHDWTEEEAGKFRTQLIEELQSRHSIVDVFREDKELLRPVAEIELLTTEEVEDDPYYEELLEKATPPQRKSLHSWFVLPKRAEKQEQVKKPHIVTFYSYKGGVGRSTTLAFAAMQLARKGNKVLVVDFDLEAPGLHSIFNVKPRYGVVDYLIQRPFLTDEETKLLLTKGVNTISGTVTNNKGKIFVLPASKMESHYIEKLSHLDIGMYQVLKNKDYGSLFGRLFSDLTEAFEPDVILVDSRTGIAETGGALLVDYSDDVCFVFTNNSQNFEGLRSIAQHMVSLKKEDEASYPNFVWIHNRMVLERDQKKNDQFRLEIRTEAQKVFELLQPMLEKGTPFNYEEVDYFPQLERFNSKLLEEQSLISESFGKITKFFEKSTNLLSGTETVFPTNDVLQELTDQETGNIQIGTGDASEDFATPEKIRLNFHMSSLMKEAMSPEKYFVRGEIGTGKSSLFHVLQQMESEKRSFIVGDPFTLFTLQDFLQLNQNLVDESDRVGCWTRFWRYHLLYCMSQKRGIVVQSSILNDVLSTFSQRNLEQIALLIQDESKSDEAQRKLRVKDGALANFDLKTTVLYDIADEIISAEPELFKWVFAGLVCFWEEQRIGLSNVTAKVFLRNDVYEDIQPLIGQEYLSDEVAVHIRWNENAGVAMVLKRLLSRSQKLREFVEEQWRIAGDPSRNLWVIDVRYGLQLFENDDTIKFVFNIVFGERFAEQDASVRDYLFSQLSDGNQNMFPWSIIKMFNFFLEYTRAVATKISISESVAVLSMVAQAEHVLMFLISADARYQEFLKYHNALLLVRELERHTFPISHKDLELHMEEESIRYLQNRGLLVVREDKSKSITYRVPQLYLAATSIYQTGSVNKAAMATLCLVQQGDMDAAEKCMLLFLEKNPSDAYCLAGYASFLAGVRGRLDEAEWYFKRAIEMDETNIMALGSYAKFLAYERKDFVKAEEYFKKSLLIDSESERHRKDYEEFLKLREQQTKTTDQ